MSDPRPDWRSALEAVVDEKRRGLETHPDPQELVAYHAGELGDEEAKRLQDHLVLCPECARALLDLDAFTTETGAASGAKVVPIAPFLTKHREWIAAALSLAASLFLLFWPRGYPLPEYGPQSLTGGSSRIRSVQAGTPSDVPVFAAGHRITFKLQPETAAKKPVTARAYLRYRTWLLPLSASTLQVHSDGVVSFDGILHTHRRFPPEETYLVAVVAQPGRLPSRTRLGRTFAEGDVVQEKRWIGVERKVQLEGDVDDLLKGGWSADDDGPRIEYAGCRTIEIGPVCHLRDDRRLTLWVRHPREEDIRIDVGKGGESYPAVPVQDGYRYDIEVEKWAWDLAVEIHQDGVTSIWTLGLSPVAPKDWLVEAQKLYDGQEWDQARRLLQPRASEGFADSAGAALSLLARIERRSGNAELGDDYYRRAIEAHRKSGHLFDLIRDAAGFTYHLIQEKRFSEARELLDSLPVAATAGSAESRNSVAYVRGLLAEKTGDYRAALAWMTRAVREAERAGLHRKWLLAEDILARQMSTVGLEDAAVALYARMRPVMADLCGSEASVLTPCDCARFQMNRAWAGLLALEAGSPRDPELPSHLDEAERAFLEEEGRGEGSCLFPQDLPNLRLNRALAALDAGDRKEARRQLAMAEVDPEAFPGLALWQLDIEARISLADGRPEQALELYDELARRAELGSSPEAAWRASFGRALSLKELDRTEEALATCTAAEGLLEQESLRVPVYVGRERFLAQRERATSFCVDLLLRAGRTGEALDVARQATSRALRPLRRSAEMAGLTADDRDPWERAVDAYWHARNGIEAMAARIWKGLPLDEEKRVREEIGRRQEELHRRLDRLTALSAKERPAGKAPVPPAPGNLLLAFYPLPTGWVAFAAVGDDIVARRIETPLEGLSEEQLSAPLLAPFADQIRRAEEIRVIPHGLLRTVDFHALPFAGGVLLDQAPVVYPLDLPALSEEVQPPAGQALVVAGPGLLEASEEARRVRDVLESRSGAWRVDLLEGTEASESGVRRRLPEVSLLHFAGHADFDEDSRGWDSHVRLGGGGRLTVDDILASPRVPRWVVLSGCETGRDERTAPIPSIGLAQAFLVAGAQSVVAVTTDVSDADAAALSEALYRHWDGSASLAAALRKAQLERRSEAPGSDWRQFRILTR